MMHSFMPGDVVTYKGFLCDVTERGAIKSTYYVKLKVQGKSKVILVKNNDIKKIRKA